MAMVGRRSSMKVGGEFSNTNSFGESTLTCYNSMAYMINENSIQFNIVRKNLGCERMAFFLNEAAGDIRDVMMPTISNKAKL